MEHPSSPKEKGLRCWETSKGEFESFMPLDGGMGNLSFEDVYGNFSNLSTLDATAGWCYSPGADPIFPAGLSLVSSLTCSSLDPSNLVEDNSEEFSMTGISGVADSIGSSFNCGDRGLFHQLESAYRISIDSSDVNESESIPNNLMDTGNYIVSRPLGWSLEERMLRALALLKESYGEGILAQVWVPMQHGNQYVLTTSEQPYLLDQMLTGFREVSRMFTFSTEEKPGAILGLPGRVFASKIPEWTSNISYYKKEEYLRVEHALGHDVRGSLALPVSDFQSEMFCCAVLELVTNKEKSNFDMEMEVVCQALQAVNLRTTPSPRLLPHSLTNNQKSALAEITDVLRAVCHAHRLPLALTWIPCCYATGVDDGSKRVHVKDSTIRPHEKCIICIEETACYVNDKTMQDFLSICTNHYLEEGQGIVGKALQSNHPFFNPDVQAYDINEYPLVHHVRKFGLNAAVAIRLRSTYTGVDDYILELFLPVNMTGKTEQQLLLNSLSGTMQRICRSLRTVSNVDLVCSERLKVGFSAEAIQKFTPISFRNPKSSTSNSLSAKEKLKWSKSPDDETETNCSSDLRASGSRRISEKKRSTAEKNVSLSVLQQYFSGSLKDAAKNIGVCPTTLKRICRQHGILRWPSRKINKVNRSLRKIQTVLDSVQGVEGGLKFDPSTGGFIATGTPIEGQSSFLLPKKKQCCREAPALHNPVSVPQAGCNGHSSSIKLEDNEVVMRENDTMPSIINQDRTSDILRVDLSGDSKSSISLAAGEMDTGGEGDDGVVEHNRQLSSSTGDSSSGSRTLLHGSSSGSQSFDDQKNPTDKISCVDSGSRITVKASYREDTIRLKFDPSWGYSQLSEEVAKRFKLPSGSFELKYLDDEKEWVMLACDLDLQECLELMEDFGAKTVKFLVRDRPFAASSSASSCCLHYGD